MKKHVNVSDLPTDVWSSILEYTSVKSMLLLLETGDARIRRIRRALQKLELKRSQVRFKPFPASFLNSFTGIRSLSLSFPHLNSSLPDSFFLPPLVISLSLSLEQENAVGILSSVYNSLLGRTEDIMLSDLKIKNHKRDGSYFEEFESSLLGKMIQQLPLTCLDCEFGTDIILASHLPPTLTNLHIYCFSTPDGKSSSTPVLLPPGLLSFRVDYSAYKCPRKSTLVIPPTVTDLYIRYYDCSICELPSALSTLHISGCGIWNEKSVSSLPRTLTSLATDECIPLHLLCHLPPMLRTLKLVGDSSIDCIDPLQLPSSLTDVDMYSFEDATVWKNLPRGLKTTGEHLFVVRDSTQFPYINDLPPSLRGLAFSTPITSQVMRSIPSKGIVMDLLVQQSKNSEFLSAFAPVLTSDTNNKREALFSSLKSLEFVVPRVDNELLTSMYLPSLTRLRIHSIELNDLVFFPAFGKLSYFMLINNSGFRTYPNAFPSFFSSLPSTLTTLEIADYLIDASLLSQKLLPPCLNRISFSVLAENFSFSHLSNLPQSIAYLKIRIVTEKDMVIIRTSLRDILLSLPKFITVFSCGDVQMYISGKPLRLILEDCQGSSCTSGCDSFALSPTDSKKMGVFLQYSPPFLKQFDSRLIDENYIFEKALGKME